MALKRKPTGTTPSKDSPHELYFLCGGGGRVVVDLQLLPTGGWRYNSPNFSMFVDPGPGALVKSIANGQKPTILDAIFVSHDHLDHCNDANAMIEAMTFGHGMGADGSGELVPKPKGTLVCARTVVQDHKEGKHQFERSVLGYFTKMLQRTEVLKAGQTVEWKDAGAKLTATRTEHEDPTAIGLVLEHMGVKLGYTADTQVFDGIAKEYEGCTHLVANCLRPDDDKFPFHLCTQDVIDMVNSQRHKPKAIVLSHIGQKFMRAGPANQARKVEQATGVRTLMANEGVRVDLRESPLSAFG